MTKPTNPDPLPILRCDQCDNGVEMEWDFCPWCGAEENWKSDEEGDTE